MSQISLNFKGYTFNLPEENDRAANAIRLAHQEPTSRPKVAASLFFATIINGANAVYETTYTLVGTTKRFPTEGKEAAKEFLIEEGTKALNNVVYTAASFFLMCASLYDSEWALSHFEVTDPSNAGGGGNGGNVGGGGARPDPVDPELMLVPCPLPANTLDPEILDGLKITLEGQNSLLEWIFRNLNEDPFTQKLITENEGLFQWNAFQDPNEFVPVIKTLLARIIVVNGWEEAEGLAHILDILEPQLTEAKENPVYIQEKQQRVDDALLVEHEKARRLQEIRELREQQELEFRAALEADRLKEVAAQEKAAQEEGLADVQAGLKAVLEGLGARLDTFDTIKANLQANWRAVEMNAKGVRPATAVEMNRLVNSNRIRPVDLGEIDLTPANVVPLADNLEETYPSVEAESLQGLRATHKQITESAEELNLLIKQAGLMTLIAALNGTAEENGQAVIDYMKA